MLMNMRHLQTFASASERLSFTRAARDLQLTQAAVSQHIAALEDELGAKLFERKGRGVELTERGQRLYGYARQILDLADEASRQVGMSERRLIGELRIATSTVPSELLLPELLAEFRARWPGVRESLTVSDSGMAAAAVEAGEADLGFVGELPRSLTLDTTPIAQDELVLVVATKHALATKGTTTLDQVLREPLIVREPGSGSRRCVEAALEEYGISPAKLTIAMEVNSNSSIRAAVERGVGVAFLSQRANRHETGLVRVRIRGFCPRRQLYLVKDRRRVLSSPSRQFLEFVDNWRSRHTR